MWTFEEQPYQYADPTYYGFCYKITNMIDSRMYIGRKTFWYKKKDKHVPSNWKSYYGSCKELNNDILVYGKDMFKREILSFHKTKIDLCYAETRWLFYYQVLETEEFYNRNILGKYFSLSIRNFESRSLYASMHTIIPCTSRVNVEKMVNCNVAM